MKKLLTILSASALFAVTSSLLALDLTPQAGFRDLEGFKIPVVNFADGKEKVTWQPPSDWQLSGGGGHLTLFPQNRAQATVELEVVSRQVALAPVADSPLEGLVKWGQSFLPRDASEVQFTSEVASPFTLRSVPTREMTFSYVSQNRHVSTSVAIADLYEKESLLLVITARQEDFAAVRKEAIKSMFRWSWGH